MMRKKDLDRATLALSPSIFSEEMFDLLTKRAASLSRTGMTTSSSDLREIEAARSEMLALVDSHFTMMADTIRKRRRNLLRLSKFEFVSLGFDCLPRAMLTRWGFKKTRKLGELTHPFDTSIHPIDATQHLIATDFSDYMDGVEFSTELGYPIRGDLNIHFNHEIGSQFAENDFLLLRNRYDHRVANFRHALNANAPTIFVLHTIELNKRVADVMASIFDNIRSQRTGRTTAFVVLHTPAMDAIEKPIEIPGQDVKVIVRPYPIKSYIWYNPRHTFSRRGYKFERQVIAEIDDVVSQL